MTNKTILNNFLIEQEQIKSKQFHNNAPAGNNGPYKYIDTPVRNTAHWAIIYSYLYKIKNDNNYKKVALKFADYICEEQSKSKNGAIKCMSGDHFDNINGLIGQAWVIESLIYVAKTFDIKKYYYVAKKIYFSQKYDCNKKIWIRVDTNGNEIDYDYTTNHQIWFIIAGNIINDYIPNKKIKEQCDDAFFNIMNNHFDIYKNGLIKHYLKQKRKDNTKVTWRIKKQIKYILYNLAIKNPDYDVHAQEKGYQVFELFGYSILSKYYKNAILKNDKIIKAYKYCINIDKFNNILNYNRFIKGKYSINKYSYGYNSPAFELPFIMKTFGRVDYENIKKLFKIQEKITMENRMMIKNNSDSETLTARIYELIYYLD